MENIPGKYSRDDAGNIYSPISNIGTVYYDDTKPYDTYIKEYIDGLYNKINEQVLGMVNTIYPIGSIYVSTSSTDPSKLFVNTTWERIQGKFLLGADNTYTAGSVGGEASVTLKESQIPSHKHTLTDPGHKHSYTTNKLNRVSNYDRTYSNSGPDDADPVSLNTRLSYTGITMASVGGGASHNNMPPYLSVYMWKRTK